MTIEKKDVKKERKEKSTFWELFGAQGTEISYMQSCFSRLRIHQIFCAHVTHLSLFRKSVTSKMALSHCKYTLASTYMPNWAAMSPDRLGCFGTDAHISIK